MPEQSLRAALRSHTSELHKRLDDVVGEFSNVDAYRAFVARSYAFRAAVEPLIQAGERWTPPALAPLLRADLDDLGYGHVDVPQLVAAGGCSANLGRLYVLEGSSVGARLLYQRAKSLGFGEAFGARHLAFQAEDIARWKKFIALLDTAENIDRGETLSAAGELFEFAMSVYAGAVHE